MAAAETGFFRGENGLVLEMDLPLPDAFAARLQRGEITRVNEDSTPYEGEGLEAAPVDAAQRDNSVRMLQQDLNLVEGQLAQVRDELAKVTHERDELRALVDQATKPPEATRPPAKKVTAAKSTTTN